MASRKTVTLAIGSLLQPAWRPSTQRSLAVGRSAFLRTTVCTTLCGNLSSCAVRVGPGTCKALAQAQVLCQLLSDPAHMLSQMWRSYTCHWWTGTLFGASGGPGGGHRADIQDLESRTRSHRKKNDYL